MSRSKEPKKKLKPSEVWREARELIWERRWRLALGLLLMLISRLAGLVLPASSKYLIDSVIGEGRHELLIPLAFAAGAATILQAISSFALSQILGVTAHRSIAEMRKNVDYARIVANEADTQMLRRTPPYTLLPHVEPYPADLKLD